MYLFSCPLCVIGELEHEVSLATRFNFSPLGARGHTLSISLCTHGHKELCVFVYSLSIEFSCKNPSLQPFE